jgi:hypothetical protein
MIDVLAFEIPLLLALLWLVRRKRELTPYLWPTAGLAGLFHLLALLRAFTAAAPGFAFTVPDSFAYGAGVRGEGLVTAVDGKQPGSLGGLVAAFAFGGDKKVETSRGAYEAPAYAFGWRPWEAFDSYELEEASAGLVLTERQPVALAGEGPVITQVGSSRALSGARVERANGETVGTARELLAQLRAVPESGVALLRVMRPTPDDNVVTVVFSPSMFGDSVPAAPEDRVVRDLGLGGVFARLRAGGTAGLLGFVDLVGGQGVRGARDLVAGFRAGMAKGAAEVKLRRGLKMRFRPQDRVEIFVRPRLELLPWIGPNWAVSWLLGFPLSPLRQALGLASLPSLTRHWDLVPHQLYNLDDAPARVPGFVLFRLSSLFTSVFLAQLAWVAFRRKTLGWRRPSNRVRGAALFALVLLLQLGDVLAVFVAR